MSFASNEMTSSPGYIMSVMSDAGVFGIAATLDRGNESSSAIHFSRVTNSLLALVRVSTAAAIVNTDLWLVGWEVAGVCLFY
mgnify:CR=1 FL=1